ncbi:hypothetical protein MRBLWH7_003833 [Microbacterium sp. LWH7-1.2]|uniref:hypothetical protein n=1 Tax=Microbacterium sp. LWH7-1.2 TaxID=3135257 RepID=UPI003138D3E5
MSEREIARAVADGELRRLQRNRFVAESVWSDLWPESRHLVELSAAAAEMRAGGGVAAYESAGVLHALPFYRHIPDAVHFTLPSSRGMPSRPGLRRHRDRLPDDHIDVLFGIRCTSLERTVFDLVRTLSPEAAIAAADAALRQVAMRKDGYDEAAAEAWRERMIELCGRSRGMRGIRQAEAAIRFVDGRSESPGESVSRLQLSRLGFRRLMLQVAVPGPSGKDYSVDIEIEDVRTFFEFDGKGKYLDEAMRSGRTLEQVLLDEKRREDWIRGGTQKRLVRAESAHIVTPEALAQRLSAFAVRPPRR